VTNPGDAGGQSSAIQSRTPSTRSRDSWVPHSKHSRRQAGIPLYLRRNPFLPSVGNGGIGELRWCGRNGVGRAEPRWRQRPLSPRGVVQRARPETSQRRARHARRRPMRSVTRLEKIQLTPGANQTEREAEAQVWRSG
jgi:hypothetical protein